jgi:hypothetical protein
MNYLCTCHTENCENNGIGIEIFDPAETVICGPCGVEITDKVETKPKPKATK